METVVIVDNNRKMLDNYRRMIETGREKITCRYFTYPEEAVEFMQKEGAAVLVCELDMPVMSGREVFDIVEMFSPATIKIAMTEVTDVRKTLEIVNQSRIFKLILKPFFLPEDLIEPIRAALKYYRLREKDLEQPLRNIGMEQTDIRTRELVSELKVKQQMYHNISRTMSGILKGSLQWEESGVSEEEIAEAGRLYDSLVREFMRYYMFGTQNYIFHLNYLMNLFSAPEKNRVFQIKNKDRQEIPNEILLKIAYTIFVIGYISKEIFGQYQLVAGIEELEQVYMLKVVLKHPVKQGKMTELFLQMEEEVVHRLADRGIREASEKVLEEELYYIKGEVTDE